MSSKIENVMGNHIKRINNLKLNKQENDLMLVMSEWYYPHMNNTHLVLAAYRIIEELCNRDIDQESEFIESDKQLKMLAGTLLLALCNRNQS